MLDDRADSRAGCALIRDPGKEQSSNQTIFIKDHVSCMSKTILISQKLIKQEPLLANAMIVAPLMLQPSVKLQAFP